MSVLTLDLIIGSIGRLDQLTRLLNSLSDYSDPNIRLIVVEQEDYAGTSRLLLRYPNLNITLLIGERGLSRARNVGLQHSSADIVGFPDDDCWYLSTTVDAVRGHFESDRIDVLIGRQITSAGVSVLRTPPNSQPVTRQNVWRTAMSSAIFMRRALIDQIGTFDSELGVGAGTGLGSGEETDIVLRALSIGAQAIYDPLVVVGHPAPSETSGRQSPEVARSYGKGMGFVLKRHNFGVGSLLHHLVRPLIGSAVALLQGDISLARFRFAVARGRAEGYSIRQSSSLPGS